MRHPGAQALAAEGPPVPAGYLGAGAGLVDEDEALRVEIELALEPSPSAAQDVGSVLLRRMRGLFLSVIFRRSKKRHSVETATATLCSAKRA